MPQKDMEELKRLLTILKRAHGFYAQVKTFQDGTAILKGCEGTIDRLHDEFGVDKTWAESAIIFGGEFVKAEKQNMYVKPVEVKKIISEQIKL